MRARLDLNREKGVQIMAKAMLIMDMPTKCSKCTLSEHHLDDTWGDYDTAYCFALSEDIPKKFKNERPSYCPLREVPQKMEKYHEQDGFAVGYNACIDELLGGGE
jgi:hypothetical protein